jgi:predicted extracellular nuclease
MKRTLLIWFGITAALIVRAAVPAVPNLGNARIVVLANNLENYYIHPNDGRGDYSEAQIAAKTAKIAEVMVASEADVLAFCEVEAKPDVLTHLAQAMNIEAGEEGLYVAVYDGIDVDWDSYYNNNIKAGFIYRSDKVQPYMSNYQATNITYYKNTMRIQAWEELATGERFTLSMNHFKAMSDDASKSKRIDNATWLVSALNSSSKVKDPDILIMGDLNCQMDEQAITVIMNAGFDEQLLEYDANAYSYIYKGTHELIDHAFANETMSAQITGAAVWHTNTSQSYSQRYSDHDAVMVGLRLGDEDPAELTETIDASEPAVQKIIRQGQIIIIRGGVEYTITGQRID